MIRKKVIAWSLILALLIFCCIILWSGFAVAYLEADVYIVTNIVGQYMKKNQYTDTKFSKDYSEWKFFKIKPSMTEKQV